jgi:peptide deformylase
MAILDVVTLENPILRKKARKVQDFKDPKLQRLINDMVQTMEDSEGVGLAAPQVGLSIRLIVVKLPDDDEGKEHFGEDAGVLYVLANPEIARSSDEMVEGAEACLSIPGYYGEVLRHRAVTIKGQDRHGKEVRIKAKEWLARVFQHEIDHLNGILYIDEGRARRIFKVTDQDEEGKEITPPHNNQGDPASESA